MEELDSKVGNKLRRFQVEEHSRLNDLVDNKTQDLREENRGLDREISRIHR